jgi:hypothetical protein
MKPPSHLSVSEKQRLTIEKKCDDIAERLSSASAEAEAIVDSRVEEDDNGVRFTAAMMEELVTICRNAGYNATLRGSVARITKPIGSK